VAAALAVGHQATLLMTAEGGGNLKVDATPQAPKYGYL
jgi:hypothetical protein